MSFHATGGPFGLAGFFAIAEGDGTVEVRRALAGLSLSALFGLAIGARYGALSMAVHAVGVPAGFLASLALSLPALCIFVAHFDLPLDTRRVVHAATRAIAVSGLVLAGLAPGAALLCITPESPEAAACFAVLGLGLGSLCGVRELALTMQASSEGRRLTLVLLLSGFVVMAALVALRAWWLLLPMLGRAGGAS